MPSREEFAQELRSEGQRGMQPTPRSHQTAKPSAIMLVLFSTRKEDELTTPVPA